MIAIIFGLIMGIVHYLSGHLLSEKAHYYNHIISFSAGISITYIFLDLFPQFSEGAVQISKFLFIFVLFGFILFHLVERYIYQHAPKNKLIRDLAIEDSVISFIYHFIVGIIIVNFVEQGVMKGTLFFIPILLYTAVSTLPVDKTKFKSIRFILSISTLLGVLFASFVNITIMIDNILLGTVIGILLFTVIRHSIPPSEKGEPLSFIIGVVLYTLMIIFLNWSFV
ncbi:hypothetical protein CMO89_03270 [Candidatus Woesearchaeota archaeon]|nr:hypothetical protein [Candidatus Woesearchaeota archaeon]|tara:strand:- start:11367 stop:12041 length:675 start_codon:yes stop_codon:yes gene_type:complete